MRGEGIGLEAGHENSHRWRVPRAMLPSRLKMRFRWRADNRQRLHTELVGWNMCIRGGGITYRRVEYKQRGEARQRI